MDFAKENKMALTQKKIKSAFAAVCVYGGTVGALSGVGYFGYQYGDDIISRNNITAEQCRSDIDYCSKEEMHEALKDSYDSSLVQTGVLISFLALIYGPKIAENKPAAPQTPQNANQKPAARREKKPGTGK